MTPTLQQLTTALRKSWTAETGYAKAGAWNSKNPARGQCVTSSLIVQDYFGGDIIRYAVSGDGLDETHYFNVLDDGTVIDTTRSQYKQQVSMEEKPIDLAKNGFTSVRERCLADDETRHRYTLLKKNVEAILGTKS